MSRIRLIAAVVFLLVCSTFTVACADGAPAEETEQLEQALERRVERFYEHIDATPEQRERLGQVKDELLKEVRPLRLHEMGAEVKSVLKQELLSRKPNADRIHDLIDSTGTELTASAHTFIDKAASAHGILTAEQRVALADRVVEREPRWDLVPIGLEFVLTKLNATDEQRAIVARHQKPRLEEAKALVVKLNETKAAVREVLLSDDVDTTRLHALLDSDSAALLAFAHNMTDAALELKETLSVEQWEAVREHMARARKHHRHH